MELIPLDQLPHSPLNLKHILGELLTILRPLISIICIRVFGIDSPKSYIISLLIDLLIILIFQRDLRVTSE
jgi:hypothetical protein